MDYQELIRAITDLSRKDINSISFRKGSKEYTWTIKLAAPIDKWAILIEKIIYIDNRLKNLIGGVGFQSNSIDIDFTEQEELVVIELTKYAGGNYGWDIKIHPDRQDILGEINKRLEAIF